MQLGKTFFLNYENEVKYVVADFFCSYHDGWKFICLLPPERNSLYFSYNLILQFRTISSEETHFYSIYRGIENVRNVIEKRYNQNLVYLLLRLVKNSEKHRWRIVERNIVCSLKSFATVNPILIIIVCFTTNSSSNIKYKFISSNSNIMKTL